MNKVFLKPYLVDSNVAILHLRKNCQKTYAAIRAHELLYATDGRTLFVMYGGNYRKLFNALVDTHIIDNLNSVKIGPKLIEWMHIVDQGNNTRLGLHEQLEKGLITKDDKVQAYAVDYSYLGDIPDIGNQSSWLIKPNHATQSVVIGLTDDEKTYFDLMGVSLEKIDKLPTMTTTMYGVPDEFSHLFEVSPHYW